MVKAPYFGVLIRRIYFRWRRKSIITSNNVLIYGLKNIATSGVLRIGMSYFGFMNNHDKTFLNVGGLLRFEGDYSIGKGCRFDIGGRATAIFGRGGVGPNTTFTIAHSLKVGQGTIISWGCQFLDDDLHELSYQGKRRKSREGIEIGSHVWVGSNVSILKGVVIPDGCMVASGSVVCSEFQTKNALIAGNPARVLRENISWS
jgi:acetyltransferase-like isoleucine patch superfamily enzyme